MTDPSEHGTGPAQPDPGEQPFIAYVEAVDAAMLALFGIEPTDAGIELDQLAAAQEEGQNPEEFALWCGKKYGLTLKSERRGTPA